MDIEQVWWTTENLLSRAVSFVVLYEGKAKIADPQNFEKSDEYSDLMVQLRSHKGVTKDKALELLKDPLYLGTLMIKSGDADGEDCDMPCDWAC